MVLLDVRSECLPQAEGFLALCAREGFLPRVDQIVVLQRVGAPERLTAHVALVRPYIRVNPRTQKYSLFNYWR